jgi:hypothetical protein
MPDVKDIVLELDAVCVEIKTILPPRAPASKPSAPEFHLIALLAVGVMFMLLKSALEIAICYLLFVAKKFY